MKIPLLLLALALCGCEAVPHYNRLQVADYNIRGPIVKKPYGTVVPFATPEDVKRPYTVIGYMTCEGTAAEEGGILRAMLYRTADLGGDAIILNPKPIRAESSDRPSQNLNVKLGWMALIGNGNVCAFRAQAIRYND